MGPWPQVAAIKWGDATTNQKSVSAVGGTWRRRAIAKERMGGNVLQPFGGGK